MTLYMLIRNKRPRRHVGPCVTCVASCLYRLAGVLVASGTLALLVAALRSSAPSPRTDPVVVARASKPYKSRAVPQRHLRFKNIVKNTAASTRSKLSKYRNDINNQSNNTHRSEDMLRNVKQQKPQQQHRRQQGHKEKQQPQQQQSQQQNQQQKYHYRYNDQQHNQHQQEQHKLLELPIVTIEEQIGEYNPKTHSNPNLMSMKMKQNNTRKKNELRGNDIQYVKRPRPIVTNSLLNVAGNSSPYSKNVKENVYDSLENILTSKGSKGLQKTNEPKITPTQNKTRSLANITNTYVQNNTNQLDYGKKTEKGTL